MYFFKYTTETREHELERIIGSDEIIKRAYTELDRFNWSDVELKTYEQESKRLLDEQAILLQKLDDATEKSREQGIKIGEERGKAKGKVEGEMKAKIAVARVDACR